MALKQYEIAFNLAAKKSGTFTKSFKDAGQTVEGLQAHMERMNASFAEITGVVKARKAVGESAKAYAQARERVAELGRAISQTEKPTKEMEQAFKKAKDALDKSKISLDKNRDAMAALDKEYGTSQTSLSALVKRQKEFEDATKAAVKAQELQEKLQKRIDKLSSGQDKLGAVAGAVDKVGGVAAGAASAGAGIGMAAGGAMLKAGADFQASMAQIQASTGATAEQMAQMEQSARAIYKSGMGESYDEVARAMSTMRQTGGFNGKELEDVTKSAMLLGKTFDMDVAETARASSALVKNFGIDGEKAFDLIAFAAQNGANKNGDLLDTFNEYAVQYKSLGFTAEQFAAHLVKGAEDGAFSIDKVGDAIKEFNIRAKDGSKSSMEAFAELGLSGETATQMFAAGGERAQAAFVEVVKRLKEIDDPVKRNAAGVALFGTQFEDLEAKALDGFLAIEGELPKMSGTMKSVASAMQATLGTQVTVVARQFTDLLLPASQEAATALRDQMPSISASIASISPKVQALGQAFVDAIPTLTQWANTALTSVTTAAKYILDNFDSIASAAIFAAKAFIGFRIALGALQVATTVAKWITVAQKAFVTYRVSAVAAAVASKTSAAVMGGLSIAVKALGAAMKFLMANPILMFLGALVAAGVAVYKNWDEIKAMAISVAQAISDAWGNAMTSIRGFFASTFDSLASIMKGPVNAVIEIINRMIDSVNGMAFEVPSWVPGMGGEKFGVSLPKIPQLAEGGIATKPTLATIAEAGEAEAVIPLSQLSTMLQPMPAAGSEGSGGTVINFAPVINIQGGGSDVAGAVQTGLGSGYEKFRANMQRFMTEQKRLSFA